jgi:transposase
VEVIYPRVAAIDVGKKVIAVAVRTPGERAGTRRQQIRKYKTFYRVLGEMVAWLAGEGVTHVAMEATGVYWKPVFHALCEADPPIEVLLVNARHVKNVPGRKTDAKDGRMAGSADRVRAVARQLHPAQGHRGDPGADPLSQEAHRHTYQ